MLQWLGFYQRDTVTFGVHVQGVSSCAIVFVRQVIPNNIVAEVKPRLRFRSKGAMDPKYGLQQTYKVYSRSLYHSGVTDNMLQTAYRDLRRWAPIIMNWTPADQLDEEQLSLNKTLRIIDALRTKWEPSKDTARAKCLYSARKLIFALLSADLLRNTATLHEAVDRVLKLVDDTKNIIVHSLKSSVCRVPGRTVMFRSQLLIDCFLFTNR